MQDKGRKAVPQFGAWEQKGGESSNYSVVFSQARAHRKQAKTVIRPLSLGNETDLVAQQNPHLHPYHHHHQNDESTMVRIFSHAKPHILVLQ